LKAKHLFIAAITAPVLFKYTISIRNFRRGAAELGIEMRHVSDFIWMVVACLLHQAYRTIFKEVVKETLTGLVQKAAKNSGNPVPNTVKTLRQATDFTIYLTMATIGVCCIWKDPRIPF
jgi:hypothetical protein